MKWVRIGSKHWSGNYEIELSVYRGFTLWLHGQKTLTCLRRDFACLQDAKDYAKEHKAVPA